MSDQDLQLINKALHLVRVYWGYTQKEMAQSLGVSQAMVSELERGSKSVSLDMLERYSRALGVRKSQLLFFAEEIEGEGAVPRQRALFAARVVKLLEMLKPREKFDGASE